MRALTPSRSPHSAGSRWIRAQGASYRKAAPIAAGVEPVSMSAYVPTLDYVRMVMAFVGAAFLRGINVGGRTVTNDRLRELFSELGFSAVTPLLASGNVIFSADAAEPVALVDRIERHLLDRLGFEVATFVRSGAQIGGIANHDPFGLDEGKVHIGFLDEKPDRSAQDEVRSLCQPGDQVRFRDTEMFWHVPGPFMGSALAGPGVARVFGHRLTVRTAKTVERIAAKLPA